MQIFEDMNAMKYATMENWMMSYSPNPRHLHPTALCRVILPEVQVLEDRIILTASMGPNI